MASCVERALVSLRAEREIYRMAFSSWRGVVGMINPTMRPGVTEEVIRLLPEGIGLIPLFLNIRCGTEDEFAAMMPAYEELVAVVGAGGRGPLHSPRAPPVLGEGRQPRTRDG